MSRNPKPINAGLELKLARRRAQDCVSEAGPQFWLTPCRWSRATRAA
jgi:hypothetical protein